MANKLDLQTGPDQPNVYAIRIKGHLGPQWTEWFDGLSITLDDSGDTLLSGTVVDQAALHGVLKRVRDVGLPLLSITRIEPEPGDAPAVQEPIEAGS